MKITEVRVIRGWLLAAIILQTACSLGGRGRAVHYYALSPQPGTLVHLHDAPHGMLIGVGPLSLPDMFDRPQIVSRPDGNRVKFAEFERWAGELDDNVQRVLLQDLAARLSETTLVDWPWPGRQKPVLQVSVEFYRFDGEPGEQARLAGTWRVLPARADCASQTRPFDISTPSVGPGYAHFVDALSLGLAQLSQEIADSLGAKALPCTAPVPR